MSSINHRETLPTGFLVMRREATSGSSAARTVHFCSAALQYTRYSGARRIARNTRVIRNEGLPAFDACHHRAHGLIRRPYKDQWKQMKYASTCCLAPMLEPFLASRALIRRVDDGFLQSGRAAITVTVVSAQIHTKKLVNPSYKDRVLDRLTTPSLSSSCG